MPTDTKKIVLLIGVRRSGKTWLMYALIGRLRREVDALMEGMKRLVVKRSFLVTADREERIEKEGCLIEVWPMWKWLLV